MSRKINVYVFQVSIIQKPSENDMYIELYYNVLCVEYMYVQNFITLLKFMSFTFSTNHDPRKTNYERSNNILTHVYTYLKVSFYEHALRWWLIGKRGLFFFFFSCIIHSHWFAAPVSSVHPRPKWPSM